MLLFFIDLWEIEFLLLLWIDVLSAISSGHQSHEEFKLKTPIYEYLQH